MMTALTARDGPGAGTVVPVRAAPTLMGNGRVVGSLEIDLADVDGARKEIA